MQIFAQRSISFGCLLLAVVLTSADSLHSAEPIPVVEDGFSVKMTDWPWWRGPSRNGTASREQSPPTQFGEDKNVRWKTPIPGRGHGSPTILGDKVFLATANEAVGSQAVVCVNRSDGKVLWSTVVHPTGAMWKNSKSSAASCTPACDGERVFVNFPNSDGLFTTALDLTGKQVWQVKVSGYVVHQGYGASPALYQKQVIVSADNKQGGALVALDRVSGEVIWRRDRPALPNYSSPVLVRVANQDQIIMTGCDQVVSYDPLTGKTLWETAGATTECVTSTVTDGTLIYTSGGYPKNHLAGMRADGSKELVWESKTRLYVPSLVIREGYLYGVLDEGIAMCWKASSGEEQWKYRLGGTFSASPVLVGDQIFAVNEAGAFFVFAADPSRFDLTAKNQLGEQVFATPTIVASEIFHRVAFLKENDQRQEWLYCLSRNGDAIDK